MVFKNKCERKFAKTMILYPMLFTLPAEVMSISGNTYLYRLASEFHYFYNNFRIINTLMAG